MNDKGILLDSLQLTFILLVAAALSSSYEQVVCQYESYRQNLPRYKCQKYTSNLLNIHTSTVIMNFKERNLYYYDICLRLHVY